jgi:hypothetical protein
VPRKTGISAMSGPQLDLFVNPPAIRRRRGCRRVSRSVLARPDRNAPRGIFCATHLVQSNVTLRPDEGTTSARRAMHRFEHVNTQAPAIDNGEAHDFFEFVLEFVWSRLPLAEGASDPRP